MFFLGLRWRRSCAWPGPFPVLLLHTQQQHNKLLTTHVTRVDSVRTGCGTPTVNIPPTLRIYVAHFSVAGARFRPRTLPQTSWIAVQAWMRDDHQSSCVARPEPRRDLRTQIRH